MAEIDERIATYLQAIEIEGKTPKTIASYANSLQDFRRVGRRLGFPEQPDEYQVPDVSRSSVTSERAGPLPATSTAGTAR